MKHKPVLLALPLLLLAGGTAAYFLITSPQTLAPTIDTGGQVESTQTGIGNVNDSLGVVTTTPLQLEGPIAQQHLNQTFAHAPSEVRNIARALIEGNPLQPLPKDLDITRTWHSPTPSLDTPSSLLRTALDFDRMDAVAAFLLYGIDANADENLILWRTLEQWTPATAQSHETVLRLYAQKGGLVNLAHEEGFTSLELAATVSNTAVSILMEAGADVWNHPNGSGAGLLERLTLHLDVPYVLDMVDAIISDPNLGKGTKRSLEIVIGNLVDAYDARIQKGLENGLKDKEANPEIVQIATLVLLLAQQEQTPWNLIPQEFLDMQTEGLLSLNPDAPIVPPVAQ